MQLLILLIFQQTRVSLDAGHNSRMLLLLLLLRRLLLIFTDEMLDAQLLGRGHRAAGRAASLLLLLQLVFVGPLQRAAGGRALRRPRILVLTRNGAAMGRKGALVIVFATAGAAIAVGVHEHVVANIRRRRQAMMIHRHAIQRHRIAVVAPAATIPSTTTTTTTQGVAAFHGVLTQLHHLVIEFRLLIPLILRPHFALLPLPRAALATEDEDDDDENDDGHADPETHDGDQFRRRQGVVIQGVGRTGFRRAGQGGGRGGGYGAVDSRVRLVAVGPRVTGGTGAEIVAVFVGAGAVDAGATDGAFVHVFLAFVARVAVRAFALVPAGDFHASPAVGARHQRAGLEGLLAVFADVTGVAATGVSATFQVEAGAAVGARRGVAAALPRLASASSVTRRTLTRDLARFTSSAFTACE